MDKLIADGKFHQIMEGHYYATRKDWIAGVGPDDREVQLALYLEITDMYEATGEKEFEQWPYLFEASVVVAHPGPKWLKDANSELEGEEGRLFDSYSYGGGVPVTHILLQEISGGGSNISQFGPRSAKWVVKRASHGTVAAQYGKDTEFKYPQFKSDDVALRFAKELLKRATALFGMIGFYMDRPINLAGETGWDRLQKQSE